MPIKRISEELIFEIVANYPDLTVLNLSNNELQELQNLSPLSSLTSINVSGNLITVRHCYNINKYPAFKNLPNIFLRNSVISPT